MLMPHGILNPPVLSWRGGMNAQRPNHYDSHGFDETIQYGQGLGP